MALGLTSSAVIATDNLAAAGQASLVVRAGPGLDGIEGRYELWAGAPRGLLLASGPVTLAGFNSVAIRG